jgi:ribosomal protein L11 methyltransferase
MDYTKIQIRTDNLPDFLPPILIAKLDEMGVESFEEIENYLNVYFPQDKSRLNLVENFLTGVLVEFHTETIQEENWNAVWESDFQPIVVDDKVVIKADFHKLDKKYPFELLINPKMAFGTGHHPTTRLVIQHMLNHSFSDSVVLDMGTGTGVLAILAEKLGAKSVSAFDNDEWAVNNAKENVQLNQCQNIEISLGVGEEYLEKTSFDFILANINRNALLSFADYISARLKTSAVCILSGLLKTDVDLVKSTYETKEMKFIEQISEGDWVALVFNKL